jgi:protocatechuate 3,4-dioxygenase beta subunit
LTYRPGDGVGADEVKSIQAGDILKAIQNPSGGWTIEPHVSSGGSTAEFYTADRFRGPAHLETAFGALAHLSGTQETMMALMDPCHDAVSGGARRISDLNGSHVTSSGYGIEIYSKYAPGTFGKSGGIGDIELLTAAAPVEIGDRVWLDSDSDGIQDASESGLAGVTVQLLDNSGSIIAEVNTSANGNYVFSNDPNGTDNRSGGYDYNVTRLHPNSQYTVRIPHVTGSGKQAALGTHVLTIAHNAAGINADLRDSNGILSHTHADAVVVTNDIPLPGSNNHHFDFGFTPSVAIGNRLFFDNGSGGGTENNGIQDGTEPGVSAGVKVELYNDSNVLIGDTVTDGNGRYYFDTLAPGKYYVKIPASEFGTGKPLNKYLSSTGADTTSTDDTHENGQDNDHPETNGIVSNVFTLTPGSEPSGEDQTGYSGSLPDNSVNATDDFGLIQLRGSWSGNVSQDTNNDDIGDKMLSGVEIKLYTDPNGDGDPADGVLMGTTTTDSNGNYRFTHLAPGNYVAVETQPTGLVNVKEDEGGADNDQGNNHIINAIAGYVDAGEEDTRNDFVEEDPNTAYRIGDLFWVDADKDGEYDSGEEVIAGATIELLTVDGQILRTTTTDANGRYHFDVPAGKYKVRFHIPKKYLDKGYKFVTIQKDGDETNKADADGLVEQAVEVGPGIATQNLTLDAAINCPCSKIQGDSADTLNIFFAFLIIMGTLILMYFKERENNFLAV